MLRLHGTPVSGAATQSGSSSAGTRAMGVLLLSRRSPSVPPMPRPFRCARGSKQVSTAPSQEKLQLIHFLPPWHFSPTSFCFVLSHFGGLSGVQESKYETKPDVGSRGPWRHQVLSCTPCCCQAPCPPLALMAHLSGQLLYWHNFRPEAGPCMLPVAK